MPKAQIQNPESMVIFLAPTQESNTKSPDGNIWAVSGLNLGFDYTHKEVGFGPIIASKSPDTQIILEYGLRLQKNGSQKTKQVSVKLKSAILGLFLTPTFSENETPPPETSGLWAFESYNAREVGLGMVKPKSPGAAQIRPDISIWAFRLSIN